LLRNKYAEHERGENGEMVDGMVSRLKDERNITQLIMVGIADKYSIVDLKQGEN
jgi:hypothetical protein